LPVCRKRKVESQVERSGQRGGEVNRVPGGENQRRTNKTRFGGTSAGARRVQNQKKRGVGLGAKKICKKIGTKWRRCRLYET